MDPVHPVTELGEQSHVHGVVKYLAPLPAVQLRETRRRPGSLAECAENVRVDDTLEQRNRDEQAARTPIDMVQGIVQPGVEER